MMEKMTRRIAVIFCCALVCVMTIPAAKADPWNKRTLVTLAEQLEVPGAVLDPGTYIFQLADSQSNRHIVQIWTGDGTYLITTILAVPAYRMQPSDHTVLNYDERPADEPMALRQWFYPGDNTGQEFVYDYHYVPQAQDEGTNGSGQ
jgi:hypothetical protein